MPNEVLEKTADQKGKEIAEKVLADLKSKKTAVTGEPKGASDGEQPKAGDQQKTEELVKKAQEQADKNVDDIVKAKEASAGKDVGDKVEKRKDEIQKEINALVAQREALKKEVQDSSTVTKEVAELRLKIAELEKSKVPEKPVELQQKEVEAEQIKRYLEEDKSKPRNERREMASDELGSWLAEDFESAQEWLTERNLRRREERIAYISKVNEDRNRQFEIELKAKHAVSAQRVKSKFPDLTSAEDEYNELVKSGKTQSEAVREVAAKYPFYNAVVELYAKEEHAAQQESRKNKYTSSENGPELLAQDAHSKVESLPKGRMYTEDEVQELLKSTKRDTPPVTISSSRPSSVAGNDDRLTPELRDVLKKANMTPERYFAAVKRRESIPGA